LDQAKIYLRSGNGGAGIGSGGGGHTIGPVNGGGSGFANSTIVNSGTITGGNGGGSSSGARGGDGGDGINGSGLTITNNGGTIARGAAGFGSTSGSDGNAITFTGGANSLTLNGGTITGNVVVNGGTLNLMSSGANTIGGGLALNAGSTYTVNVTAAGATDRLTVNGTATLAGAVSAQAAGGSYAASTTYTILTATTLSGSFASVSTNLAFLKPSLSYDATNVYLTLSKADFVLPGGNANQSAVGRVLNAANGSATGDFAAVLTALSNLDTTQGPRAIDAISGQPTANLGTMNTQTASAYMGTVGNHLSATHGGAVGTQGASAALAEPSDACDVACEPQPRLTAWLSGVGGIGTVPGSGSSGNVTYNFGGAAVGADYRLDPSLLVGAGLGFQSGTQWADGFVGRSTGETVNGSLYASYTRGAAYLDGLVSYGRATNRTTRTIVIAGLAPRTALGQTQANQFLGQLEAGYRIDVPLSAPASVTPFVRVQGATTAQDGFTETGADSLNLTIAGQTTNSLRTVLGADFAAELAKVTFGIRLGWAHEHADIGRPMTASFAGVPGNAFTVYGASPARDAAVLGLSVRSTVADATDLYARYDGEAGNGADSHALTAGLRIGF
ncbi:MAG: autotransporter domain-containing protein, partial [Proteobacteria bacterium]|nr:autotransporter domain-containing protein [Pseudomonadota bacterium]